MDFDRADRLLEALQTLEPAQAVRDAGRRARQLADRVAGKDLPRAGERAQACRAVERAAPEAADDRHSLARVEADPDGPCELARGEAVLQCDREAKRRPGRVEHDEHLVAASLLERPAELGRQFRRHRLEPACERRARLVALRTGVGGVAAQVGEHERANPRGAHRRIDVVAAQRRGRGVDQLRARRVPVLTVLGEGGGDDVVEACRQIDPVGDARRRTARMGEHRRKLVLAPKRRLAGE